MRAIGLALAGTLLLAAVPASAEDHTVTARNGPGGRHFDPATLTIAVGDTVTFVNDPADPGFHNVASDPGAVTAFRCANGCDGDGGNGDPDSNLWSATVAFPTAGSAPYYCEIHGGPGGAGMSGVITVTGGTPTPVIAVDPTSLAGPAATGGSAVLGFSVANSGDATLDWSADTASASCDAPDDVPWLLVDPVAGSIPAGDPAIPVGVLLDAASLAPGVYEADICLHSNDPVNDPLALPVTFTVTVADFIFADGFELPTH
jgi:plastocyanin